MSCIHTVRIAKIKQKTTDKPKTHQQLLEKMWSDGNFPAVLVGV